MKRRLAWLLLILAIPPAIAGFWSGLQFVSMAELAVRLADDDFGIPSDAWKVAATSGLEMLGVAVALFIVWRAVTRDRSRTALIALAAAWVISAPTYWPFLVLASIR